LKEFVTFLRPAALATKMFVIVERTMETSKAADPTPSKVPSSSAPTEKKSAPTEKKRKRPVKKKPKETPRTTTPPPMSTLVIDNGGHTLKYGWATSPPPPKRMPNITAKLQHQWIVLVGDELDRIQPNQLESTTRSTERGIITNLANQIQVWKRVLDHVSVVVPIKSEASEVFGWKVARTGSKATILPQSCAVLLLMPPHCPRSVLEQVMNVWFQEFQFAHVGFATSPVMAAIPLSVTTQYSCACVVDMGWSATHIVPTNRQSPLKDAIRRMPLGGRHLIQLWKYYMSYRQWNLMDQEFLLEAAQRELGFFSLQFDEDLKLARRLPLGKRPYDREFVLPDYSTTHHGVVRLPAALQQQVPEETKEETATEKNAENVKEDEVGGDEEEGSDNDNNTDAQDEEEDSDDDESDEVKRRRILRQRQEQERRRQELDEEHQVLMVSVERFAIPEVLFRPTDAGWAPNLAGLPEAIVASISSCPRQYQAAMYQSIRVVGGLCLIPNLQARLERELQCLAPCQYEVNVKVMDDAPIDQAWLGGKQWVQRKPHSEWSIGIDEWEEASRKDSRKLKPWHRLLAENGGAMV
jgi:actin-related protein 6